MPSYYRGTKYSIGDLQGFLRAAGWPEDLIVTMAAIGMAESSGWSGAVADYRDHHPPEYSVGLWQINLLAHRNYTEADMSDPLQNAQAAIEVYQNEGPRAWGPYITGVYKKFLPASQSAYSSGNSAPVSSAAAPPGSNDNGSGAAIGAGTIIALLALFAAWEIL